MQFRMQTSTRNCLLSASVHSFVAVSLVGGRIDGKSTCEDYCQSSSSFTSVSGAVLNPFDTTRSAGGSSSGSAVLVSPFINLLSTFVHCYRQLTETNFGLPRLLTIITPRLSRRYTPGLKHWANLFSFRA